MGKSKYASDFRNYMNAKIKSDDEKSSTIPSTLNGKSTSNISAVSLDIWDKKYRLNSDKQYSDFLREPVTNQTTNVTVTLSDFASQLGLPVQLLIEQFNNAGIPNLNPGVIISERHKSALLEYLRKQHGAEHTSKITLSRSEIGKKRVLLYENAPQAETKLVLENVNDELMFYLAKNPEIIYKLGSRKFEEMIAKLFADRGYEVSLTKSTRDGGYDILARVKDAFSAFIILAECKKYSPENKVGVEVVRGLYGVTEMNKANQGLIITSSFFTKDAHQEQLRIGNRIGLKDYNNLVEWLKPYSK